MAQSSIAALNAVGGQDSSIAVLIGRVLLAQGRLEEAKKWLVHAQRSKGESAKVATAILKIVS